MSRKLRTLREIRLSRGATLAEFSARAGLSVQQISLIERGQRGPSPKSARRLASAYGVRLGRLYELIEDARASNVAVTGTVES